MKTTRRKHSTSGVFCPARNGVTCRCQILLSWIALVVKTMPRILHVYIPAETKCATAGEYEPNTYHSPVLDSVYFVWGAEKYPCVHEVIFSTSSLILVLWHRSMWSLKITSAFDPNVEFNFISLGPWKHTGSVARGHIRFVFTQPQWHIQTKIRRCLKSKDK